MEVGFDPSSDSPWEASCLTQHGFFNAARDDKAELSLLGRLREAAAGELELELPLLEEAL